LERAGCFDETKTRGRLVFLDVGSNIGNHVRFLYEWRLYPKATVARDFFEKAFGPQESRVNSDVCVFSFEPNPDHYERHEHLAKAYGSHDWRYTPIHAGVGHHAGSNITFYPEMTWVSPRRRAIAGKSVGQSTCPSFVLPTGYNRK